MYFIKPKFWDKKNNSFLSILLYPLSIIYYLIKIIGMGDEILSSTIKELDQYIVN